MVAALAGGRASPRDRLAGTFARGSRSSKRAQHSAKSLWGVNSRPCRRSR